MNYLEIINKCLAELNYKQVNSFAELVKNDHKKLKNIINLVNTEVCSSEKWNFLLRQTTITLPKNTGEIENTVNGRFALVLVDGVKYEFFEDFRKFLTNSQPPCTYSVFNDKILFPIFDKDKQINIFYYSANTAFNSSDTEKSKLENADDTTIIPDPYAEPLLVYGTCLRMKANPQHVKFSYWMSMYKDALANMRSHNAVDAHKTPNVTLFRY